MTTEEIIMKAPMDAMGEISRVIQSRKGDFLSIDQEGDNLIVIAKVPISETNNVNKELKEILGNSFSLKKYKKN